jgi:Fe-S-cluster containining protein
VDDPLKSYQDLVEKVDAFFCRVAGRYGAEMRCAPGCDDCCRRCLSLFPFEVERMMEAAEGLPGADREAVIRRARRAQEDPQAPCPLLEGGLCRVYPARPIICRTHGLPLLVPGENSLSMCPYNLKGMERLDGDCVLDLGPVNRILATINHLAAASRGESPERVRVCDAILERFGGGGAR